MKEKTAGKR